MPDLIQTFDTDPGSTGPFAGEAELLTWLVSVGEEPEAAAHHLDELGVGWTCLLDHDSQVYLSYDRQEAAEEWAPFPLHVVVGRDGTIRYLATQYDALALEAALTAALAE